MTWRAVAEGAAPVVVGARSALFLPFPDLGLVVIDEEHETAFKQEDGVVYHARDMAVVRARFCSAPAVLVSATPRLETLANVEAGRYRRLTLPTRHGGAGLPTVAAIDMRATPPERGRFLAPPLVAAVPRHAGARRAGDAVPQPPRLCAADAVPALRPPHAVPELHRLAGGAPRPARAAMPPLRPRRADPGRSARNAARRTA